MTLNRLQVESETRLMLPQVSDVDVSKWMQLVRVVISSGATETPGLLIWFHGRMGFPVLLSGNMLIRSDADFVMQLNRADSPPVDQKAPADGIKCNPRSEQPLNAGLRGPQG